MEPAAFRVWKLLAPIGCFAAAAALLWWTNAEVDHYGGGFLPVLCILISISFVLGGLAILSKTARAVLSRAALIILRIVSEFGPP